MSDVDLTLFNGGMRCFHPMKVRYVLVVSTVELSLLHLVGSNKAWSRHFNNTRSPGGVQLDR
jgi:hypothetical protein